MSGITSSAEPITDGQTAQIKTFVEHALRKSGVGKDGAQLIIARGDDLKDRLTTIFEELGIENEFADEKVEPDTDYSYDIRTLPGSDEQLAHQLERLELKGIEAIRITVVETMGEGAEGFGAIPSLTDLGKLWGIDDPLGAGYGQVLERLLGYLKTTRDGKFYSYLSDFGSDYVRLHSQARRIWERLEQLQSAEEGKIRFFVVPINFGHKYQGFSPRNARTDALAKGTMPLDPATVAALLLGWSKWQEKFENLVVDCPGAEYSWYADGEWTISCYFIFNDGRLKFNAYDAGIPYDRCGAAVAFPGVLQIAD
ncbi:MAG TPA: hypothetical protein VMQ44_01260 [Candidatus Saccharimonadales bacterium]|nr:hypothetical protein [Candidatus Saccharimonadales bacterium]